MDLQRALTQERRAAYGRLRGGFPIPLSVSLVYLATTVLIYVDSGRYVTLHNETERG